MPYTPLAPRCWNTGRLLRTRRGALFLTNFLSNPAIVLDVLPSGAGVQQRLNHKHCSGPSFIAPANSLLTTAAGVSSSPAARGARLALNRRRGVEDASLHGMR